VPRQAGGAGRRADPSPGDGAGTVALWLDVKEAALACGQSGRGVLIGVTRLHALGPRGTRAPCRAAGGPGWACWAPLAQEE